MTEQSAGEMFLRWVNRRTRNIDYQELDRRLADLREALSCAPPGRDGAGPGDDVIAALLRRRRPAGDLAAVVDARAEDAPPFGREQDAGSAHEVRRYRGARFPVAALVLVVLALMGFIAGGFYWYRGYQMSAGPAPLDPPVRIRVGVLPLVDVAALYQAVDRGYFRQAGLDVEVVTVSSGPEAVREIATGALDVAFSSYPGMFIAQAKHLADLKVIAPAYIAAPGHLMLVTAPDRSFTKPEQAPHKRIAVTSKGSISDLFAKSGLRRAGGDPDTITWVTMDLRAMLPALQRGEVDGAVVAEPFVTEAENIGAVELLDLGLDLNFQISMSGWAVASGYAAARPDVIDAFQAAMWRGVADIQDRAVRESIFEKYLGLDTATAQHVRIATYPARLDVVDLQRVADLMKEQGFIDKPLDVAPMLVPGGPVP